MKYKIVIGIIASIGLTLLVVSGVFAYLPEMFASIKSVQVVGTADPYLVIENSNTNQSLFVIDNNANAPLAPTNFTATIDNNDIDLTWLSATGATHTVITRGKTKFPTTRDDGVLIAFVTGNSFTDEGATEESTTYYYSAWSFSPLGYSNDYTTVSTGGIIMFLLVLVLIPLGLTIAMFATKNSMLGFPAALFWAIFGGYAYTQSTVTWDIYFLLAFGSLLGMVTFSVLAGFGLRERRDTIADAEMDEEGEEGEGEDYFDEKREPDVRGAMERPLTRVQALHARTKRRREKLHRNRGSSFGDS